MIVRWLINGYERERGAIEDLPDDVAQDLIYDGWVEDRAKAEAREAERAEASQYG